MTAPRRAYTTKVRLAADVALSDVRDIERQARRHRCAWRAVERMVRTARFLAREAAAGRVAL